MNVSYIIILFILPGFDSFVIYYLNISFLIIIISQIIL